MEVNLSPKLAEAQVWVDDLPSLTRSGTSKAVKIEVEQLLASHDIPVVDIPSDGEKDTGMVQPVVPPS